jgi:hypothetical protein
VLSREVGRHQPEWVIDEAEHKAPSSERVKGGFSASWEACEGESEKVRRGICESKVRRLSNPRENERRRRIRERFGGVSPGKEK